MHVSVTFSSIVPWCDMADPHREYSRAPHPSFLGSNLSRGYENLQILI